MVPGDMRDPVHVAQDLAVLLQEPLVEEIVVFQPREGAGVIRRAVAAAAIAFHRGERVFPRGPGAGIARLDHQVAGKQALVVGLDQIAALLLGDHGDEARH
jgi:hypothetical protein